MSTSKNPVCIEKWKLAVQIGISYRSLARMLNEIFYDDLVKLNYNKYQKIVYRHQLDFLFPHGIDFEKTK